MQALPGFEDKYHNIVDYILKITEEIWEKRAIWEINNTYTKDVVIHSGARKVAGIDAVINGTLETLSSFPDRKMKGEAVIWSMDDEGHFYTSHRIGSTATNEGASAFGKATGKKVFFRTIADCKVANNKIYEEWLVRDNLYLVQQLGFDPVEMAKRDQRYKNKMSLAYQPAPISTNNTVIQFDHSIDEELILSLFKTWNERAYSDFNHYYTEQSLVHAVCNTKLTGAPSVAAFVKNLLDSFPHAEVTVKRITSNQTNNKTELAARWTIRGMHNGNGFFKGSTGIPVIVMGISHFIIKDGKITEEWMVFDGFDVLCQIHANDGIDLTHSSNGKTKTLAAENRNLRNKNTVLSFIKELNETVAGRKPAGTVLSKYLSSNVTTYITKPFTELKGPEAFGNIFWQPLTDSFSDLEVQPYIVLGGEHEGQDRVCLAGNFIGNFTRPWLGIPPNGKPVWIRFGAHLVINNDKVTHAWIFIDMLDVMRQAGFNFFPLRGIEQTAPPPATGDGLVTYATDEMETKNTLHLTNAMIKGLMDYDGRTLASMAQERFWDVPNMMWYGPSGIGTTKGLRIPG
jgi:predicted ester cyclase